MISKLVTQNFKKTNLKEQQQKKPQNKTKEKLPRVYYFGIALLLLSF